MKKKLLAFGMAVLMLTGCGSSSGTIRFGAAGLGGTYHMFSDAFAEIIESESADCSIEVKTTAGSAANVRLLSDGYVRWPSHRQISSMMHITEWECLKMIRSIRDIPLSEGYIRRRARL